ncbi:translocation/assembly module TamB domain-containing protein [Legionella nagasakiensis]|uniref:translocation/assembly module TamB domain-containing protein n=1 Tax=Legionella nagasakiensis TaxID=535290 RepID=UPI0013EF6433|nr:translocation/assembly module TamB domain-containing protein [Legionella nagasakiensis]
MLAFFLVTTPGFYTAVKLANLALPGKITLKKPQGQLIKQISFTELDYEDNTFHLHLDHGRLTWNWTALFHKELRIKEIHADTLLMEIKDTPEAIEKAGHTDFSLPQLPIMLTINKLTLNELRIKQAGAAWQMEQLYLQTTLNSQQWTIHQFAANYGHNRLLLEGNGQPYFPYAVTANLTFKPTTGMQHHIQGDIKLSGNLDLYHWQGQFSQPAKGTLHGTLKNGQALSMQITWHDGKWPIDAQNVIENRQGRITMNGTLSDLLIKAQVTFDAPAKADLDLHAHVHDKKVDARSLVRMPQGNIVTTLTYDEQAKPRFKGEIKTTSLTLTEKNLPLSNLELTAQVWGNSPQTLSATAAVSARYMDNLLKARINYQPQKIHASLSLGANHLEINGTSIYQWQATASLPQPMLFHPALANLQTTLISDIKVTGPQQGKLTLTMTPGIYQSTLDKTLPPLRFQGGQLTANLSATGLKAAGHMQIDRHKQLDFNGQLPEFRLDDIDATKQTIQGTLNLHIDSLDFLAGVSPAIEKPHGRLDLKLSAEGKLNNPIVKGDITLNKASVFLPKLNLALSPIQAKLLTHGTQWTATGSIGAQSKTLTMEGKGAFAPEMNGSITINGEQFPIVQTSEHKVHVSPSLSLDFKPDLIDIKGTILVPSANLKPINFSSSIDLTDDAVFVSDKQETSPFNINADIELKMGQQVALDVKGLHGFLDGALKIRQIPQSEPFAVGELTIRDGKYQAYGQDLTIEEGQLIFTGGKISNPGIRLRAVRYFKNATANFASSNELFDFSSGNIQSINLGNKTTVGIEVSGRVDSPEIKLFSIPANLSQADILSMIILGKPASQASRSGGQLLLTAISAMNLDSGTKGLQLLDQLKQTLGFDFNIQSTSQYHQETNEVTDSTAFVVGKAITNRLYLSYNIGLFQEDSNVLTLKYLLNKFFSIQVTASDSGSGMDLLYTHSKD